MTTSTPTKIDGEVVWSLVDWPEDSDRTDAVISESVKARAELVAAMAETRAARAES